MIATLSTGCKHGGRISGSLQAGVGNPPPGNAGSGTTTGGRVLSVFSGAVLGRLIAGDAVVAAEPAAEIDRRAAGRAKRLVRRHGRLAADRAAARPYRDRSDGIISHRAAI